MEKKLKIITTPAWGKKISRLDYANNTEGMNIIRLIIAILFYISSSSFNSVKNVFSGFGQF